MNKISENEFEILKLGNPVLRLTAKELTKKEILWFFGIMLMLVMISETL